VILHLVTDRRRLCPDGNPADRTDCLRQQVAFAADAGVDVVQIREPDLETSDLTGLVAGLLTLVRGSRTRLVVNDRIDVAIAAGAAGVHLRADGPPAAAVRSIVPGGFLIGRSVHTEDEARRAGAVDYLIAGTVWPTPSKPGAACLGESGLARIVAAAGAPVLAIGGVDESRIAAVARTGAHGLAAIGLFMADERNGCRAVPLQALVGRVRAGHAAKPVTS
jgi:thiamine-phosphate pyrophosphorylase